MAAGNLNRGVAIHRTGCAVPYTVGVAVRIYWLSYRIGFRVILCPTILFLVRVVTRAATEDIAVEGVAVGTMHRNTTNQVIDIVRQILHDRAFLSTSILAVRPAGTFGQRVLIVGSCQCLQFCRIGLKRNQVSGCPFLIGIGTVDANLGRQILSVVIHLSIAVADLTVVLNLHIRISLDDTVLATAIDRTLDEGVATDGHLGFAG